MFVIKTKLSKGMITMNYKNNYKPAPKTICLPKIYYGPFLRQLSIYEMNSMLHHVIKDSFYHFYFNKKLKWSRKIT